MTTRSDWEFRASYLRDAALRLDRKADALKEEASRYRALAVRADIQAGTLTRDAVIDVPRQYGASHV